MCYPSLYTLYWHRWMAKVSGQSCDHSSHDKLCYVFLLWPHIKLFFTALQQKIGKCFGWSIWSNYRTWTLLNQVTLFSLKKKLISLKAKIDHSCQGSISTSVELKINPELFVAFVQRNKIVKTMLWPAIVKDKTRDCTSFFNLSDIFSLVHPTPLSCLFPNYIYTGEREREGERGRKRRRKKRKRQIKRERSLWLPQR